jgi:hypothetical protein
MGGGDMGGTDVEEADAAEADAPAAALASGYFGSHGLPSGDT